MADAAAYHAHIPGNEGTGVPADVVNSNTVTVGSAITNLWTNSGWMTTVTSSSAGTPAASGGFYLDQPDWDLSNNDSMLLMFWVKMLGPGDKLAGTRFRTSVPGWYLVDSGTNDTLSFVVESSQQEGNTTIVSDVPVFDNKAHHVALAVDGTTKRMFVFVDGRCVTDVNDTDNVYAASGGDTRNDEGTGQTIGFGIAGDGGGAEKSYAGQWRDIHSFVFKAAGLPKHLPDIVNYAISNPYTTLSEEIVSGVSPVARKKNILLAIVGQSNEGIYFANRARPILATSSAAGSTTFTIGASHGLSATDTLTVSKSGETSATTVPIQSFDTDSVTVLDADITAGTYDEDGGYLYSQAGIGNSAIGCPNRGTAMWTHLAEQLWKSKQYWTHTLDRFAIGGSSFITDWCGTSGSGDSRTVFSDADVGFDPNNYLANLKADIENWSAAGFDELWVIVQHGQADAVFSGTFVSTGATTDAIQKAYYQSAVENIIDYLKTEVTPNKIYVASSNAKALGASGNDDSTQFANVIVPGLKDAAAAQGALIGPMLSELLEDAASHNLLDSHLNEDGQRQAGEAWADSLQLFSGSSSSTVLVEDLMGNEL
jgi:hypothetical protein